MLAADSWIVPVLHGEPYLDKPPLLYWLVMALYSCFGVHDWAARLVPCSAAFFTICVTYFWGRCTLGLRGGFLAAMILALSVRYVYLARLLTMDTVLCLFVVAAVAGMHLALREAFRWRPWLIASVACGLGLLTKGPVILVLVCIPALALVLLSHRVHRPSLRASLAFFVVMSAVAAPWYVATVVRDVEFAHYFFWKHHVERFVTPFDHQEPFWFYLPVIMLGMMPWTLLLPGLLRQIWRRSQSPEPSGSLSFLMLAFGWCVLFFSASGCKRPSYILPAMPLLALALGAYLDRLLMQTDGVPFLSWRRSQFRIAGMLGAVAAFVLLFVGMYALLPGYARRFSLRAQVEPLAELCKSPNVEVACYPRRWDSVSFYLGRNDVRVYTREERAHLVTDVSTAPATLLYVKSAENLDALLGDLPPGFDYVPTGPQGELRVGIVRRKEADARAPRTLDPFHKARREGS
jgi:4-amino-4-deoxy-L-arabinose transferase-like glycosyltransferase